MFSIYLLLPSSLLSVVLFVNKDSFEVLKARFLWKSEKSLLQLWLEKNLSFLFLPLSFMFLYFQVVFTAVSLVNGASGCAMQQEEIKSNEMSVMVWRSDQCKALKKFSFLGQGWYPSTLAGLTVRDEFCTSYFCQCTARRCDHVVQDPTYSCHWQESARKLMRSYSTRFWCHKPHRV